jgi:SAM-dependent methyltransferase
MPSFQGLVRRIQRVIDLGTERERRAKVAEMERVFQAPPLTTELVSAIKLISPHLDFAPTEQNRLVWEEDNNRTCWREYEILAPLFQAIPKPKKILEIGPGLGRSLIFFSKKFGWNGSEIHAYDGEGSTTKYTILGDRFEDSYCGNLSMLRSVLEFNNIRNIRLFNARNVPLVDLQGSYDLLYSFYSIGYHWSLELFLDDLLTLMNERSIAVFTVPQAFRPFPKLKSLSYKVVDWKSTWSKDHWSRILILSKEILPDWT